ncbi:MAG: hypothetical protein R3A13_10160 [Bdellovibrionota bacterium]
MLKKLALSIFILNLLLFFANVASAQTKPGKLCVNTSTNKIITKRKCKSAKNEVQASAENLSSLLGIPKILTAVIDSDGSKVRGDNVVSSVNLDKSDYHIVFDQDITSCTPAVTKSGTSSGGTQSTGNVAAYVDLDEGTNTLYVAIFNGSNSAASRFNIVLICP